MSSSDRSIAVRQKSASGNIGGNNGGKSGFGARFGGGKHISRAEFCYLILGLYIGTALEWYDFQVYAQLNATLQKLFFPAQSSAAQQLSYWGVYAVGFLTRPVGSVLFGHVGDAVGRKPCLIASIATMAVPTVLIGCLPTYSAIGVAAPILLALLRAVQGLAMGGEFGCALVYLTEIAPLRRQGFVGSLGFVSALSGIAAGVGMVMLIVGLCSQDQLETWGWRLPFLLAAVLALTGLLMRWQMPEPDEFLSAKAAAALATATAAAAPPSSTSASTSVSAAKSAAGVLSPLTAGASKGGSGSMAARSSASSASSSSSSSSCCRQSPGSAAALPAPTAESVSSGAAAATTMAAAAAATAAVELTAAASFSVAHERTLSGALPTVSEEGRARSEASAGDGGAPAELAADAKEEEDVGWECIELGPPMIDPVADPAAVCGDEAAPDGASAACIAAPATAAAAARSSSIVSASGLSRMGSALMAPALSVIRSSSSTGGSSGSSGTARQSKGSGKEVVVWGTSTGDAKAARRAARAAVAAAMAAQRAKAAACRGGSGAAAAAAAGTHRAADSWPFLRLLRDHWWRVLLQFFFEAWLAVSFWTFVAWLPSLLQKGGMALEVSLALLLGGLAAMAPCVMVCGWLCDRGWPRMWTALAVLLLATATAIPVFLGFRGTPWWAALLLMAFYMSLLGWITGLVPVTMSQLYPAAVRATGFSFAHNCSMSLLGGLAPTIVTAISLGTGSDYFGPGLYLMCAGLASMLAGAAVLVLAPEVNRPQLPRRYRPEEIEGDV